MKKFASLLIALMLCLSAVAFAEAVPSKTTGDLTNFVVAGDNIPADANLSISTVVSDDLSQEDKLEACNTEIAALAASESVAAYFGEVKNAAGEVVDLASVLGAETLNVNEFCPIVVTDYEETYGNVKTTMQFSTPYAAGEKVVVLIGVVTVNADGTQSIEWVAFEGVGVGTEGAIEVELNAETMAAIEGNTALLAVVSK